MRDALRKLSNKFTNSKQHSALYLLSFSDVFHRNSLEVQCKTSECFMMGDGPAAFDPTEFCCLFPSNFIFFAIISYLLLYSSTCHHIIIFVDFRTLLYLWMDQCICCCISVFVAVLLYLWPYQCICCLMGGFPRGGGRPWSAAARTNHQHRAAMQRQCRS